MSLDYVVQLFILIHSKIATIYKTKTNTNHGFFK